MTVTIDATATVATVQVVIATVATEVPPADDPDRPNTAAVDPAVRMAMSTHIHPAAAIATASVKTDILAVTVGVLTVGQTVIEIGTGSGIAIGV